MSCAIFYASSTGNTKHVATLIGQKLRIANIFDISDDGVQKINEFDSVIIGASTWGEGDLQDDWESVWSDFSSLDFSGKTVALFGLGDQEQYCDNFLDAMGMIYEVVIKNGGSVTGAWPAAGYCHDNSRAQIEGYFVGLAIDEDNEPDLTADRIDRWCLNIKGNLNLE